MKEYKFSLLHYKSESFWPNGLITAFNWIWNHDRYFKGQIFEKSIQNSILAAQAFSFRGDEVPNKESQSCLSYTGHVYWSLSMPLPNIIKIFQTI